MSATEDNRLQAIQDELTAILEARLGALHAVLQNTESITRRIISADVELERHNFNQTKLETELSGIDQKVEQARAQVEDVTGKVASLTVEHEQLSAEIEKKEQEVRTLDLEANGARKQIAALEEEAGALREENASLRTKVKTLQENIVRMQRLKDELMSSVTGLAQQLRQASGTE